MNLPKRLFLALLACFVLCFAWTPLKSLAYTVKGAGTEKNSQTYEAVPKGHEGYVPSAPAQKITDDNSEDKDKGSMGERIFASVINGINKLFKWAITGVNLHDVLFGVVNPLNGKKYGNTSVGHIFSAAEWNNAVNPLRIAFSFVAWALFAAMIAMYGFKIMQESTNPLRRSNLIENLYAWIGAAAMLAFMYMLVFIIFDLNDAFVYGLDLISGGKSSSLFKAMNGDVSGIAGPIGDALINLGMSIMTVILIIQYIFRKFIIAFLVVISPLACVAYARHKDATAFKIWISELVSQVFTQTAHATVVVLYLAFAYASMDGKGSLLNRSDGSIGWSVSQVIDPVLSFLISIGGVVAVGALILNGIRLSLSSNNPTLRMNAMRGVKLSLIGGGICIGAVIVVDILRGLMF